MSGTRKKCTTPCPNKDDIGGGQFCKFKKEFDGTPPCPKPPNKGDARAKLKDFWKDLNESR